MNNLTFPEGIYDLKKLIKFLNNVLGEYDIFISNDNGKIRISVNMYIEYWLNQKSSNMGRSHDGSDLNKFHLSSSSCNNLKENFKINLTIKLSPKRAFMLGFINHDIHFEQVVHGNVINSTTRIILSDFYPTFLMV